MIHFLPDQFETSTPYYEAVSRLASLGSALNVAERSAGLDPSDPLELPEEWSQASGSRRRCFEARSVEIAQAAAAGLEMLAAQQASGAQAHPKSIERLALTLRTELAGLDELFSL